MAAAHERRFRFGVQVRSPAMSSQMWAAKARRIEELGYSTLLLPDHVGGQPAPLVTLAVVSSATERLRVGTLVLNNDFRHPVMLAKEAATLDVFSGGRFELGIGAGWMNTDYLLSGIELAPPSVRIERLGEAVTVMRGLFAAGPFTFDGEHYAVTNVEGAPKPLQQPGVPLLLGGGGRRMLHLAGSVADIVGINPNLRAGVMNRQAAMQTVVDQVDEKVGWVREGAGSRFEAIELSLMIVAVLLTEDRTEALRAYAERIRFPAPETFETPYLWFGTVDEICADLERWRSRWGVSYWIVPEEHLEAAAPVVAALAGK